MKEIDNVIINNILFGHNEWTVTNKHTGTELGILFFENDSYGAKSIHGMQVSGISKESAIKFLLRCKPKTTKNVADKYQRTIQGIFN